MPKFDKKELKKLIDEVDAYDDAYYNENKKLVSDAEYDGLKDRLKTLSHDFEPQEGSKTDEKLKIRLDDALSRVGAPPPKDGKWKKVQHEVPMTSLNKVNLPTELGDWHKKCGTAKELFSLFLAAPVVTVQLARILLAMSER
jgi:NAD-dependent DNA ligase